MDYADFPQFSLKFKHFSLFKGMQRRKQQQNQSFRLDHSHYSQTTLREGPTKYELRVDLQRI